MVVPVLPLSLLSEGFKLYSPCVSVFHTRVIKVILEREVC